MRWIAIATLAAGCHDAPAAEPDAATPDAATTATLTVTGGYGGGTYTIGDTVHVWSDVAPRLELLDAWSGDAGVAGPHEWHTTLVMPDHDVALVATKHAVPIGLAQTTYTGPSGVTRAVYAHLAPGAKGLVLFLHGTGGSAKFITTEEALYVAHLAIERGYAVLGLDAEEVVAGDLSGDGNIRWNLTPSATNHDLVDLDALIGKLRTDGTIGAATPVYALGMSNGGATSIFLGTIGATALSSTFPNLHFAAVISHCADGPAQAATISTTPTAWRQCGRDDNPQVSNAAAMANSATLAGRGIATEYVENPPSPLYDQRFERAGVDATSSAAIATELRAAGFTDASGLFTTSTTDIEAAATATPAMFPTLTGEPGPAKLGIQDQLRAMHAEHQMYSDFAARDVDWFDAHP